MDNRTAMARAERLYALLRGESREWFSAQVLGFEQVLATQDARQIEPARRRFEALLDQVERDGALDWQDSQRPH
jgi:molecular chaperone HscC